MKWKLSNPKVVGRGIKSDEADEFLDDETFKERVQEGSNLENTALRKAFTSEVKASDDTDKRIIEFTISTARRDRDGDVISPDGWNLKDYKKNPVVLWGHNPSIPPVGRSLKTWVEDGKLKAQAEFADVDVDPTGFSDTIYRMLKSGYLKATSVGFLPQEFEFLKEKDDETDEIWVTGLKFTKQDLLEFSVVGVPSNADALISDKNIDSKPYKDFLEQALDEYDNYKDVLLVPKDKAAEVYKTISKNSNSKGSTMVEKTTISYNRAHENGTSKAAKDTEWDGPAEVTNAEVDDLWTMCAWVDNSEDNVNKGDFKLPHHESDNKDLVWRGVTAAMGALMGARGGVDIPDEDRRGVYDHLTKHYEEFDEEAPEFKHVEDQTLKSEDYTIDEKGQITEVSKNNSAKSEEDGDVKDTKAVLDEVEELLSENTTTEDDFHSIKMTVGDKSVDFTSTDKAFVSELYEKFLNSLTEEKEIKNSGTEEKEHETEEVEEKDVTKSVETTEEEYDLEEIGQLLPDIIKSVINEEINKLTGKV